MEPPMEPRKIGRSILHVVVASPLFVTAPLWRGWHQRWGATDQEARGPMPGDELLAKPSFNATRAITIKAPPERVWPWIVQTGYDCAGFYSYDLFDHGARPSARRIWPSRLTPRRCAAPSGGPRPTAPTPTTCASCCAPAPARVLDAT